MAEYNDILATLPKLKRHQLEEIRRRSAAIIQLKTGSDVVAEEDWLLYGITQVLTESGLGEQVPANFRLRNHRSFAGYQTQSERVKAILERACPGLDAVEKRFLGLVSARALAQSLRTWTEVSFDNLMHHIGKTPSALDQAFPGYLSAGLLPLLLRSHQKEKVGSCQRRTSSRNLSRRPSPQR